MLALAARYDASAMTAAEIAADQGISVKYLESLLASLKAAGLVVAGRGSRGGYALARRPERITLLDVLAPLEDLAVCVDVHERGLRFEQVATRRVWKELRDATESILKRETLASLLRAKGAAKARNGKWHAG
jgi:Rrf2 family protein